jgi:iron complex outermembrane receptor protein
MNPFHARHVAAVALTLSLATAVAGQRPELGKLSIDDLMNVEVTSVARRGERLSDTPAAVFIISREDIERSGATTIPEVLRIVPGLDVASLDGNIWAVSARGDNSRWADKLLVMIDGRVVYSPLFSGVYWDLQDTVLEDIDRIEVIRGPGGTLWGANAVNGIINIITRSALVTQGALASVSGGGPAGQVISSLRYGGGAGDNFHFRVFGKAFDRDPSGLGSGARAPDGWQGRRAGFRADWTASHRDNISFQAESYHGRNEERFDGTAVTMDAQVPTNAGDALLKWTQSQSQRSETSLQIYSSFDSRHTPELSVRDRAFDLDFQHELALGQRHHLVWGLEYRRSSASTDSPSRAVLLDQRDTHSTVHSAFFQDEARLPHDIRLIFGTKIQHEPVNGLQFQPSLRALWRPDERQTLWAAATSAIRTPSWAELASTVTISDDAAGRVVYFGNPHLASERVESYEAGYRWLAHETMSLDVATFYERMHNLSGVALGTPYFGTDGKLVIPMNSNNDLYGDGAGVEVLAKLHPGPRADLTAGYTYFYLRQRGQDLSGLNDYPAHQLQLRSAFPLTPRIELDGAAYYVRHLASGTVPGYIRFDARLAWHASPTWDISIAGQNLFDNNHREFIGTEAVTSFPVNRSIYGKVTWRSR